MKERTIHKWIPIILVVIVSAILIYIAIKNGWIGNNAKERVMVESEEFMTLDIKDNSYIGVNNKQVYKVTRDGIRAYDLDKQEVWSDTFSLSEVLVKQTDPYIAVGSKSGKSIYVFNEKGRQTEINTQSPVIYFDINQNGNVVTIQDEGSKHHVTAYSPTGQFLCTRTSFVEKDGYPIVAEISPKGDMLLISYISTNEPEVTSTIIGMSTKQNDSEELDNVMYGVTEKDNLVYSILFMSDNTWVSVGDKYANWYDKNGSHKIKKDDLYSIFVPRASSIGVFNEGFLPLIVTSKPVQSTVHQDEKLVVFDNRGEELFTHDIKEGANNLLVDKQMIIYETGGRYEGYNKLGNKIFTYSPTMDVSRVIYFPDLKKGIAINKEKVMLLSSKK